MSESASTQNGSNKGPSAKNEDGLDMKTLFVRSIPTEVTDEELSSFFSNFAPLKHAVVVKDAEKNSRGFGFVSFAQEEDTKQALTQARRTALNGVKLRVDIAKRRDRSKKKTEDASTAVSPDESQRTKKDGNDFSEDNLLGGLPKLIIRNMPWSCRDPNKLKTIFSRYGTVVHAKIPKKADGKLCGFAFVTMKRLQNCKLAIENSKDLKIDGRSVAVDFAVEKTKWEGYQKQQNDTKEDESENEDSESEEEEEVDEGNSDGDNDSDDVELASDEEVSEDEEDTTSSYQPAKKNKTEDYSVFVRNVPYDATEESLADHFTKFGAVKYALPVIDKETGLAKGTAFVAFREKKAFEFCIQNAPAAGSTSLLIGDDVLPEYVYEGRVLSITPTLKREDANKMADYNAFKRKEILGKAPGERDRRNMYLLNEGKVVEGSKLAELLSTQDMEIRDKSYKLRVDQLKKNPSLHLSLTRLAIRNLPRAMTDKSLKALGRKAVVEFATEVKNEQRHPLSKEEVIRSTKEKYKFLSEEEIEKIKKKDKKQGIVRQAKVIMEIKGSHIGRSRGYGFLEYRDHKAALMGLRWLNVHKVSAEEILDGMTDEEKKKVDPESLKGRRLCVEFAIENANIVKRRRENVKQARVFPKRGNEEMEEGQDNDRRHNNKRFKPSDKYNSALKKKHDDNSEDKTNNKSGLNDDVKRIIGFKRKRRHTKK